MYENYVPKNRYNSPKHTCARCDDLNDHVYEKPDDLKTNGSNRLPYVLLTTAIVLCAIVIGLTVYDLLIHDCSAVKPSASTDDAANFSDICFDCTKLVKNSWNVSQTDTLLKILTVKFDNNVQKCCAKNPVQIAALLELCLREQVMRQPVKTANMKEQVTTPDYVPSMSGSPLKFTPAYAHKSLLAPKGTDSSQDNHFFLRINTIDNDSVRKQAHGVTVEEDGLVIQFSGLYYVYSSVYFRPNLTLAAGRSGTKTWYHYVHRLSPNIPDNTGQLLQTVHTVCHNCAEDRNTAFTGGVFRLEGGDVLHVCVSGQGLVDFNKESTFLGLMMLGSDNHD